MSLVSWIKSLFAKQKATQQTPPSASQVAREESEHKLKLLSIHRRNIEHLLKQQSMYAEREVPFMVANQITDTRSQIARLKSELRAARVSVDDQPGDE